MAAITTRYEITTTTYYGAETAQDDPETIVRAFGKNSNVVWKRNGVLFNPGKIPENEQVIDSVIRPLIMNQRPLSTADQPGSRQCYIEEISVRILTTKPI